jgi:hypothetical protein
MQLVKWISAPLTLRVTTTIAAPYSDVAGECMYSPANYANYKGLTGHPPVIGWSFDGYEIYGRHLSNRAVGYNQSLDLCGGHSHNDSKGNAMDYHAQVVKVYYTSGSTVQSYYSYIPGPFTAGGEIFQRITSSTLQAS